MKLLIFILFLLFSCSEKLENEKKFYDFSGKIFSDTKISSARIDLVGHKSRLVDKDGTFRFNGLKAGTYTVKINSDYYYHPIEKNIEITSDIYKEYKLEINSKIIRSEIQEDITFKKANGPYIAPHGITFGNKTKVITVKVEKGTIFYISDKPISIRDNVKFEAIGTQDEPIKFLNKNNGDLWSLHIIKPLFINGKKHDSHTKKFSFCQFTGIDYLKMVNVSGIEFSDCKFAFSNNSIDTYNTKSVIISESAAIQFSNNTIYSDDPSFLAINISTFSDKEIYSFQRINIKMSKKEALFLSKKSKNVKFIFDESNLLRGNTGKFHEYEINNSYLDTNNTHVSNRIKITNRENSLILSSGARW